MLLRRTYKLAYITNPNFVNILPSDTLNLKLTFNIWACSNLLIQKSGQEQNAGLGGGGGG